jgi:enoyl-CoA hydratase/carnithine racemase
MSGFLRVEKNGKVLRLTLIDPHSRNSLSDRLMASISEALKNVEHSVSVVVIAAEGAAFCSGHNLKELTASRKGSDGGEAYFKDIFDRCAKLMIQIAEHRCVIITEIAGLASAAGCQLVATSDLAYASTVARFCTPGVNIGLFCSTPMVALSRNVSRKHGMEMLLTGDVFDAAYALRIGLVNEVVEPEKLTEHVTSIAEKLSSKSATAIAYGKKLYTTQRDMPLQEAYKGCGEVMVANMLDVESIEGIGAFLEKRKPNWNTNEPR